MSIEFIPGEYSEQGRASCYKYLKDKYIREKLNVNINKKEQQKKLSNKSSK